MKTDNLISALVADLVISSMPLQRTFALALVMGSAGGRGVFPVDRVSPRRRASVGNRSLPVQVRRHAEPRRDCNRISRPSRAAGCFARSLALGVAGSAPAVGTCGGDGIGGYARRDVVAAARWLECPRLPDADPPSVDWAARMHLACLAARGAYPARPRWCCCRARRERYRSDALCLELH